MAPTKPSEAFTLTKKENKGLSLRSTSAKPRGIDKERAYRLPQRSSSRNAGLKLMWDPRMGGSLYEERVDGNHAVSSLDNHAKPRSGQANVRNETHREETNEVPRLNNQGKSMASLFNKVDKPSPRIRLSPKRRSTAVRQAPAVGQDSDDEEEMDGVKPSNWRRAARTAAQSRNTPASSEIEPLVVDSPPRRPQGKTSRLAPPSPSDTTLVSTKQFSSRYGDEECERKLVGALTVDPTGIGYFATFCFDGEYNGKACEQVAEIKATLVTEEKRLFYSAASVGDDNGDVGLAVKSLYTTSGLPLLEVSNRVNPSSLTDKPLLYVDLIHILPAHQGKGLIGGILHTFRHLLLEAAGSAKFSGTLILMPGNPNGDAGEVYEGGGMTARQIAMRLRGIYEKKDGYVYCAHAEEVLVVMARGVEDGELLGMKKRKAKAKAKAKSKGKRKGKARL